MGNRNVKRPMVREFELVDSRTRKKITVKATAEPEWNDPCTELIRSLDFTSVYRISYHDHLIHDIYIYSIFLENYINRKIIFLS